MDDVARAELDARRAADAQEGEGDEGNDEAAAMSSRDGSRPLGVEGQPCDICGGTMRRGALFADREICLSPVGI